MKRLSIPILTVTMIVAAGISLTCGRFELSIRDIWEIITGTCGDSMKISVFSSIRLPRVALAMMSGAALSLAGWVFQTLFANPLAAPDSLGVSSACSLGAAIAIVTGAGAAMTGLMAISAGLLSVFMVMLMTTAIGRGRGISMLLSGMAVGALASAAIMLVKFAADPERQLAAIDYWIMGSLHSVSAKDLPRTAAMFIPAAGAILIVSHPIRVISLGDEDAISLGVPAGRIRVFAITAATVLTACMVSVTGVISWIGLIVPHVCRLAFGEDALAPVRAMLAGATLMTFSDLAARSIITGEIPVSVMTAFAGAVFLIALLIRTGFARRRARG